MGRGNGKELVASGLELTLSVMKCRTEILDLDVYGASIPYYLDVTSPVKSGNHGPEPKLTGALKVMSVALFTGDNAVPIRGD